MSDAKAKGIRVVDTDNSVFEYAGADSTQLDGEQNLLVVKGDVAVALFSRNIWHHAEQF